MYRPKKRMLVRRVSAASVVAVVAAAGLGITFISQSGATTSALKTTDDAVTKTTSSTPTTKSTTPKYHVVGLTYHDDSKSSGDN